MGKVLTRKKRLFLMAAVFFFALTSFAQSDIGNKLSITTQLFLNERDGKINLNPSTKGLVLSPGDTIHLGKDFGQRFISTPTIINGREYISAFIRINDDSTLPKLEARGVIVRTNFDNGLLTTYIPIDSIESVARISTVNSVNVGSLMRKATDNARKATNTDDVLTHSADAAAAGLSKKYDGKGVLVGVIDEGIDFNHIAFKDANGNSRIKRVYAKTSENGTAREYTSNFPSTDNSSEDHGTHTSSTAGGSNVIISGSNVTVTDDASKATYGGMAPGADLYLVGTNNLDNTVISDGFAKIIAYADAQNEPVVVSNSWGGSIGPRDGTGDMATVVNKYFGDKYPNHVVLFAASNDAGNGGMYISGTASSSRPLGAVIKSSQVSQGYNIYPGAILDAWTHSAYSGNITIKVLAVSSSGTVTTLGTVTPTANGSTISISNAGFKGTLYAYKNVVSTGNGKTEIMLYATGSGQNQFVYGTNYLAFQIYPPSGSVAFDCWTPSGYTYFDNSPSASGYSWTKGSDKSSISNEPTMDNVIAVGAYVSKNRVTDYNGSSHSLSSRYPNVGDIAYFSSYQEEGAGATGKMIPWISAPGATIVAAVNSKHTSSSYVDNGYADYGMYRVNGSTTYPYGNMDGTSMATPTASGIVALWLQAAKEVGKTLTVNEVKTIMKETAIRDSWVTTGSNKTHFGNGKIDALAGLQYIVKTWGNTDPSLTIDQTSLSFTGNLNKTTSKTVKVAKANLTGNVTVKVSGTGFSVSPTTIAATDGTTDLTVNFTPTTLGTFTGKVTLTSGSLTTTISLSGTAAASLTANPTALSFSAQPGSTTTQTVRVKQTNLTSNVTATVTGTGFSVSPASIPASADSTDLTVTFAPTAEGNYTGKLTLTSGSLTTTVALTGKAQAVTGGSATDAYLNVANYKTIGTNQSTSNDDNTVISNIYKYTEDADNGVAWLTLSAYTAGTNEDTQKWLNVDNWRYYSTTSWTGSEPFKGSSAYFSSNNKARVISTGNSSNRQNVTANYYVTNVSEVKALGYNNSSYFSSYSTTLNAYECTLNSDGTVTASSRVAKTQSSSSRGANTLTLSGLSPSKIYKIEWVAQYGNLREIAFETPIEVVKTPVVTATPTALTFSTEANTPTTKTFTVTGSDLNGNVTATLADANNVYSLSAATVTANDAAAGKAITVTFSPKAAGTFTGTVTLTSEGAKSITVTLSGTATEQTSSVRYKSSSTDRWHYLLPDANGAYNITDGDYYAFEVTKDVDNAKVNYTRDFSNSNEWYPWYMPFDVDVDNELLNSFDFGRFEGIYINGDDNWQIGIVKLNNGDKVYANVPYVVRAKAAGQQTIASNGATLFANATGKDINLWSASNYFTFKGINTKKTTTANDNGWYVMSEGAFTQQSEAGLSVDPLSFYLTVTTRTDNPYDGRNANTTVKPTSIQIIDVETATGIKKISSFTPNGSDAIYDLQGRRVNKTVQGVYISNGKKVVIK